MGKKSWYSTALYIRLSREETETDSTEKIHNQKELLLRYISGRPEFQLEGIYCDNGISGMTFDRPQWNQLMEQVKKRQVDCIIVKDLSRLGRNYIEAGDYLEKVFPFLNVRFIAVSDGYDSSIKGQNSMEMMLPLKNIINASYAKDLSRKIKSARHIQRIRGEYTGSRLPYGYKRDPYRKGKLIVDEKEAHVVKMIFSWIEDGYSYSETARELNRRKITAPQGNLWSYQTIKVITSNRIYIGTLTQGNRCIGGSDSVILENELEAIIDTDTFSRVSKQKEKISFRKPHSASEGNWLFQGMLIAANSGKKLYKSSYLKQHGKVRVKVYRSPRTYDENGIAYKMVLIREETLLVCLKTVLTQYLNAFEGIKEFLKKETVWKYYQGKLSAMDERLRDFQKQLERKKELLTDCYTDMADGLLSPEDYRMYSNCYKEEIIRLEQQIEEGTKERKHLAQTINLENPYIAHLEQFGKDMGITRVILKQLVSKIIVFASDRLEIQFRFADEFQQLQEVAVNGGYGKWKNHCTLSEDFQA